MPLHHILLEAMKIAAVAEAYEVNCAPHNFYGHMSALMSAHFCAAIPNFRGFPEYCQVPAPRLYRGIVSSMLDLMPAPHLIYNEWDKHGTWSGLAPRAYFVPCAKRLTALIRILEGARHRLACRRGFDLALSGFAITASCQANALNPASCYGVVTRSFPSRRSE